MNENLKRAANLVICYGAWFGAVGTAVWVVFFIDPTTHPVRWPGLVVILLMGIGITASLIRSRYRMADTMREVFYAGMRAGWNTPHRERPVTKDHLPEDE